MFLSPPSPPVLGMELKGFMQAGQALHNWTTPPDLLLAVFTLILSQEYGQVFPDRLPVDGSKQNRGGNLVKEPSCTKETFNSLEKA